jgi:hypothetical protein
MNRRKLGVLAMLVAGASVVAVAGDALPQAGTGPGSGVPGLGGSDSGPGSAIDANKGTAAGTRADPHSGTMVPEPGQSRGSQGIAEVPPGIGEKGTGQIQGTMERSGGEQGTSAQGTMAQVPAGIGERGTGQMESTLERSGGGKSRR